MEFGDFLRKQEEVYVKFRDTSKLRSEGTKPNIPASQGGYLIAFRHPERITQQVEDFSRRISQAIPAIVYEAANVHTTVATHGIENGFSPDKDVLEALCDSVWEAAMRNRPVITYSEWLYNQNTVIVAGMPNSAFLDAAETVNLEAGKGGIKLRLPWGAHITAGRFSEQKSPAELEDFFRLMSETQGLGESVPEYIDVAYFEINPKGFRVTTHERFKLK